MSDDPIELRTRADWRWRSADGSHWTLDTIKDSHLVNLERYLLGRGDLPFDPSKHDYAEWKWCYDTVREEIDRRGLELLRDDHAGALKRHYEASTERRYWESQPPQATARRQMGAYS